MTKRSDESASALPDIAPVAKVPGQPLWSPRTRRARRARTLAVGILALSAIAGGVIWSQASTARTSSAAVSGNLLSGDASNFEHSTGGWTGSADTIGWSSSVGNETPGALLMTATANNGMSAWSPGPPASNDTAAQTGYVYKADAFLETVSGSFLADNNVRFYNSAGSVIGSANGQTVTITNSGWASPPPAIGLAPSGTAFVSAGVSTTPTAGGGLLGLGNSSSGQQLYVDDVSLVQITNTPQNVVGPLTTSGTRILQANGQPITLRGVDLSSYQDGDTTSVTQTTIAQIKAWGANTVRVDLDETPLVSTSCDYQSDYLQEISQAVGWITGLGMVALLDLHQSNPADFGVTGTVCEATTEEPMPDAAGSTTFWTTLANTFKSNPLVAFDLFNEPHDITGAVWLNGGQAGSGAAAYQAVGMQQLYNTVRGAGAANLILATGLGWGNDVPPMLAGKNIVYSTHVYTCPVGPPPTDCPTTTPYDPSFVLKNWIAEGHVVPVMVAEFGYPVPGDGFYNSNTIAYAEANGWSWSIFQWNQTVGPEYGIVATPTNPTAEPDAGGMPALCDMAAATSSPPGTRVSACGDPLNSGYRLGASDGGIFNYGAASFDGSMGGHPLNEPIVSMAQTADNQGYWLAAADGGVFTFGDAAYHGSMGGQPLRAPIVGMAADAATGGYWLVASDGGIFAFDAPFLGSMGGQHLKRPIVGMAATSDGGGYWLVASDGGVFSFGDAAFEGSTGALNLVRPIVGMAPDPVTGGYWLVASDGGIFAFDAPFFGSAAGLPLRAPIVGIAVTSDDAGYWLAAADGGIFNYGDAAYLGSAGAEHLVEPIVALTGS
jgi:aryl-phospho-beta-D-glucosidase BglC (GH1 family)